MSPNSEVDRQKALTMKPVHSFPYLPNFDEGMLTMKTNRPFWMLRMVVVVIVALGFTGHAVAQSPSMSTPGPDITDELMARLIKRTLASNKEAWISPEICAILAMCDGTSQMPSKQISRSEPDGKYYVVVPLKKDSKDVIVAFKSLSGDVVNSYLTDKSGNLRAAAISGLDGIGLRLITNEQAAEKFKVAIRLLAKLAKDLPP